MFMEYLLWKRKMISNYSNDVDTRDNEKRICLNIFMYIKFLYISMHYKKIFWLVKM